MRPFIIFLRWLDASKKTTIRMEDSYPGDSLLLHTQQRRGRGLRGSVKSECCIQADGLFSDNLEIAAGE